MAGRGKRKLEEQQPTSDWLTEQMARHPENLADNVMSHICHNVQFEGGLEPTVAGFNAALTESADAIASGDMAKLERMLVCQAELLNLSFNTATVWAFRSQTLEQTDAWGRLAHRSQNQCRRTIVAIAELKNPKRATFIKQQNNAVNQQINNAENSKNSENELLGAQHGERLDGGAAQAPVGADSTVAAMGVVDGAAHGGGEKILSGK